MEFLEKTNLLKITILIFFTGGKWNCEKRRPFSGTLMVEVGNQSLFGGLRCRRGISAESN
jgi:hypothetical protein